MHQSTTDPESRLYRKSCGKESKLAYRGNALVENRNGLIASAMATQADGHAERDAALLMLHERQKDSSQRITVGADKAYDTKNVIAGARALNGTADVQKNETGPLERRWKDHTARRLRTLTQPSMAGREDVRLVEADRTARQVKLRGLANIDWVFVFSCAAHNLLRLPKLVASQTQQSPQQKCA